MLACTMRSHRLNRLTLLTQGIALIGFGMSELACGNASPPIVNGPAPEAPHVNAPPAPTEPAHVNAPPTTAPSGSASATPLSPKPPTHTNAPNTNAK